MNKLPVVALGAAGSLLAVSSAQAASFDLTSVLNDSVTYVGEPVLHNLVPVIGALLALPLKRFFDQKTSELMASNVDALLDKAIAYAAREAKEWITHADFHVNIDSWLLNLAADYALRNAPGVLKRAGALAASKAANVVSDGVQRLLLHDKIEARLDAHPAVATLKAGAPAAAPAAA